MYTQIWNKYLPVIRILIKRSATGQQVFDLNRIDFERAGGIRKSGYKFNILFSKGRVSNVISDSQLAQDLASVLLGDPTVKELFTRRDYQVNMTPKFQLVIKSEDRQGVDQEQLAHHPNQA